MIPATPIRPIPGAYFNTPAPGANTAVRRRLNFNEPTQGSVPSGLGPLATPVESNGGNGGGLPLPAPREELPPVAKAAETINKTLQLDDSFPDLDSYCRRKPHHRGLIHGD